MNDLRRDNSANTFTVFQLINLADLFTLCGIKYTGDLHVHVSRLDDGDLTLLPGTEPIRLKLYAVQYRGGDKPELVFKSMFQPASWKAEEVEPATGWQIIFTEDFVRTNPRIAKDILDLPFLQVPKVIPLTLDAASINEVKNIFATLEIAQQQANADTLVFSKLLHELLLAVKRLFNRYSRQQPELQLQVKQADKSLYIRFKALLEKLNFKAPQEEFRHLAYYAETLEVNSQSLNTAVKRFSGYNALHLIQEKSLAEAKNLLRSTSLSVKEISYKMAFRDPAQFGVFFKKHTGITPAQFRENLRRWP